jgi:hypothetical protein
MLVLTVALGIFPCVKAAAQNPTGSGPDDFYCINVQVEKVFPYAKGYVVDYAVNNRERARTFIPIEWFYTAPGNSDRVKGEVVLLGVGTVWPSMTVFYNHGTFSSVKLYLRKEPSHISWGNIAQGVNLDQSFQGVTEIKLRLK